MTNRALALLLASAILLQVLAISGSERNLDVSNFSNSQSEEGNITLENGRDEVITFSFEVISILDLHGIGITLYDGKGNAKIFEIDVMGSGTFSENSNVVSGYLASNVTGVLIMLKDKIDSLSFFEAELLDHNTIQVASMVPGDIEDASASDPEIVRTSIIDGEEPRVEAGITEVVRLNLNEGLSLMPYIENFEATANGGSIISGNGVETFGVECPYEGGGYDDGFIIKLDSSGNCLWQHRADFSITQIGVFGEETVVVGSTPGGLSILGEQIGPGGFFGKIRSDGVWDFVKTIDRSDNDWEVYFDNNSIFFEDLHRYELDPNQNCDYVYGYETGDNSIMKYDVSGKCEFRVTLNPSGGSHTDTGAENLYWQDCDGSGGPDPDPAPDHLETTSYFCSYNDGIGSPFGEGGFIVIDTHNEELVAINATAGLSFSHTGSNYSDLGLNKFLRNASLQGNPVVLTGMAGNYPAGAFGYKISGYNAGLCGWNVPGTNAVFKGGYAQNPIQHPRNTISSENILIEASIIYEPITGGQQELDYGFYCERGLILMNARSGDFRIYDEDISTYTFPTSSREDYNLGNPNWDYEIQNRRNGGFCIFPPSSETFSVRSSYLQQGGEVWFGGDQNPANPIEHVGFSCFDGDGRPDWRFSEPVADVNGIANWEHHYSEYDGVVGRAVLYDYRTPDEFGGSTYTSTELVIEKIFSPEKTDHDHDSVLDLQDHCLWTEEGSEVDEWGCSWGQRDEDGDGWANQKEIDCLTNLDESSDSPLDTDGDWECDLLDDDDDGDGAADETDIFPLDPTEWRDFDGDGIGDNSDEDDDNDGWSDEIEISCYTNYLDSTSLPADIDGDGGCDDPIVDSNNDGVPDDVSSFCEESDVRIFLDSRGCNLVFGDGADLEKRPSDIEGVRSVSKGLNTITEMVISRDGSVLAVLDEMQSLTVHNLDDRTSDQRLLGDGEYLATVQHTGRIVLVSDGFCSDILLDIPCDLGWENGISVTGSGHYWSGPVYFSEEYTPCKPGFSGIAHCKSGWFRVGDWNEFYSPSIKGIVSYSPNSEPVPCPGCASPDGKYIADVVQIVTDWELLGGMDMRTDVLVSEVETWASQQGENARPGGVSTVVGGYNVGSCGSLVCLFSELGDDLMFDFGGIAWSGDSAYLYAATSDSIVTIDPEDGKYWEMSHGHSCETVADPSQFTGVSTPDGSRVVIPCGSNLLILDIERGAGGTPWWAIIALVAISFSAYSYHRYSRGKRTALSVSVLVMLVLAPLSGCLGFSEDLDKDSERLPSTFDLDIQGGINDGELVVFARPSSDVPPETVEILIEAPSSHEWFRLGYRTIGQMTGYDLNELNSYNVEHICDESCPKIEVSVFYRGALISQQTISR